MRCGSLLASAFYLILAQPAQAQVIGQAASHTISPWRIVASLLLCLALGGIAILALRHRYGLGRLPLMGSQAKRRIAVIEQQSLGPQRSICLIEIDGRDYAALFAPQAAVLLPLPEAGAPSPAESNSP